MFASDNGGLSGESMIAGVDKAEERMSVWLSQTFVIIQCSKNLRVPLQGLSIGDELGPKIRWKGVVDGHQMNIAILLFVGPEEWRRLG